PPLRRRRAEAPAAAFYYGAVSRVRRNGALFLPAPPDQTSNDALQTPNAALRTSNNAFQTSNDAIQTPGVS
ncbi:MAG: hypothetical protein LBB98_07145, partial [Treponema sp.]|nr:hypothetical protein [Treponema sp.]